MRYVLEKQNDRSTTALFDGTSAMSLNVESFSLDGLENQYDIQTLCLQIGHSPDKSALGKVKIHQTFHKKVWIETFSNKIIY